MKFHRKMPLNDVSLRATWFRLACKLSLNTVLVEKNGIEKENNFNRVLKDKLHHDVSFSYRQTSLWSNNKR